MSNLDFFMFRMKIIKPQQLALFSENISTKEIFKRIIFESASEIKRSNNWHIGNIHEIDNDSGYFAVGRTTLSKFPKYDASSGDFKEETDETSPFTGVFYESEYGILAIAQKSKLSPSVIGIANRLRTLFQSADIVFKNGLTIQIDPISDPKSFIEDLQTAYSIVLFSITFTRPNPFDVDKHFQKPMEEYLQATNGIEGNTIIKGSNLNPDTLVDVTQSVAATGNDAYAKIKKNKNAKVVKRYLRNNPAHFIIPEEELTFEKGIEETRKQYFALRGKNE